MKRKLTDSNNSLENKRKSHIYEQNTINFASVPSLESMAVVNLTVSLFKQPDTQAAIHELSLLFNPVYSDIEPSCKERFDEIERNILQKLSHLPLPNVLKTKVSNIIRPIELQLINWTYSGIKDIEYMDYICWTNKGTIDRVRTLERFTEIDECQCIHIIYQLACTCCLEGSIPNLWNKLPKGMEYFQYDDYINDSSYLIKYWTDNVKNTLSGKLTENNSENLYNIYRYKEMFTLALSTGNSLAVKHFWKKLTVDEINDNLTQWVDGAICNRKSHYFKYQDTNGYADILYFLLSKMNGEQQREVLRQNCNVILNSLFVDFPYQRFLLPTMEVMWKFIDNKVYVQLLTRIVKEIKENRTTQKLLRELWYESPMNLKKHFIRYMIKDDNGTDVLIKLSEVEDMGTIKLILNDAHNDKKKKIFLSLIENSNLRHLIYKNKLLSVNILLQVLLESGLNCIKKMIVFKHGISLCSSWIHDNNWKMVETFFSWAFSSENQSEYFKREIILKNKHKIAYSLLLDDNYELLNKFIDWWCDSEHKINKFKKQFIKCRFAMFTGGMIDWSVFEKFIDWTFASEQEVSKLDILNSSQFQNIIYKKIVIEHDFKFVDKLISWCCHSKEEIEQYKSEYVLSETWIKIFQKFVPNNRVLSNGECNMKLIGKLFYLFYPFEENVKIKLKEKIASCIYYTTDEKITCCTINKEKLLHFIDSMNDVNFSYYMRYSK